jgi:hypothetical protein
MMRSSSSGRPSLLGKSSPPTLQAASRWHCRGAVAACDDQPLLSTALGIDLFALRRK